jgi:hypothetical protein
MRLVQILLTGSILIVPAACAGKQPSDDLSPATANASSRRCEPVPDAFMRAGPVYRDCDVDQRAVEPRPLPPLQYSGVPKTSCSKVVIDMVVDTLGKPVVSTVTVVRSTDPQWTEAIVSNVSGLRYKPARKNGLPVQQLVRYERVLTARVVSSAMPTRPGRATATEKSC